MRKLLVIFLISALFSVVVPILGQDTTRRTWSAPQLLGDGWWQSVVVDLTGRVHVAWYYSIPNQQLNDVVEYTYQDSGGEWQKPKDILATSTNIANTRPSMAITTDGIMHMSFRQHEWHLFSNVLASQAYNPNSWSTPVLMNTQGYYDRIIADRHDILHLVFNGRYGSGASDQSSENINSETSACYLCYNMFYRPSLDGGKTWEQPYPIETDPNNGADRPGIIEGNSGRLYIFWERGFNWFIYRGKPNDVRYVYSDDNGETWSAPIVFDGGNYRDRRPQEISLTEMLDGKVMVVWRYSSDIDRHIYYQLSNDSGRTWTDPTAIPGVIVRTINDSILDTFDLLTDQLGYVHFFFVGHRDGQNIDGVPGLYSMTYSQGLWLEPERVYYDPLKRPEWPRVALSPLNDELHLTWFVRFGKKSADGGEGGLQVFYSNLKGILNPKPVPTYVPTATAQPTATAFRIIEPTTTPFPTLEGVSPITVTTADNYAAQTFLGGMLISALFCGAVILMVRLRR